MKPPRSPINGFTKILALILLATPLVVAAFFLWGVSKQQVAPAPLLKTDAQTTPSPAVPAGGQRTDEKSKMIHFLEQSLRDAEKKLEGRTDESGRKAILKQIDDYKIRIAKMKAEIGG